MIYVSLGDILCLQKKLVGADGETHNVIEVDDVLTIVYEQEQKMEHKDTDE